jgi:predicted RecA/RadA family phage recombinase
MSINLKAERHKSDDRVVYTNAGSTTIVAGTPVQVHGYIVGIAVNDIAAGESDELDVTGRFRAWGVASQAWTAGTIVGWDADGDPLNGTAGSGAFTTTSADWDFPVGIADEAKGATVEMGVVRLNEYGSASVPTTTTAAPTTTTT